MTFQPGAKLGPYEILNAVGAGGMGEVYRGRDTRIDRTVAIKVLPNHLAANPDLRQRLDREARAISSLNHPNICALYDVGHQNGTDYLIMEYLEGEPLSTVLEKGPLPTPELLQIAIQLADALDKAHRQGLVHRDLKPGNIILTRNGAKLLDFGLAKWQAAAPNGGLASITRTSSPLTGEGTIVGTFQYMSPEQLEGMEADARSDLFSLGVVLYEMATGKRPFDGKSQASLIASIMKEEPRPISALQPMTPPALERVVKQCLAKDADERWQTAGDLKRELNWIVQGGSQVGVPAVVATRRRRRFQASWIIAAVAASCSLVLAALMLTRHTPPPQVARYAVAPDTNMRAMRWPKISPDGRTVAFLASDTTGKDMIWVRPINSLTAYPLPGTEGAWRPFWSPDSRYLAFTEGGQLKKISVTGGPVQLVGETKGGYDGSWSSRGIILFDGANQDSIRSIAVAGGPVNAATTINHANHEQYHCWPTFLSDGNHFIFLASTDSTPSASSESFVAKVGALDSKEIKTLFATDSKVEYDRSGYLLYVLNGILMARRFDVGKLEVQGDPTPVAEHVSAVVGGAGFSLSDNGMLVYQPTGGSAFSELVWVDRTGKEIAKVGDNAPYRDIALSPDEKRIAYGYLDPQLNTEDIWVRDLTRNVSSRLTFDPKDDIWPVWSPDGTHIAFTSNRSGNFQLMWKVANGTGSDELLYKEQGVQIGPYGFSQDGRLIAIERFILGQWDVGVFNLASRTANWVVTTSFNEQSPAMSPDGRYLAYESDETGVPQVYVLELGGAGGKWQISSTFGRFPAWRSDGKELYYVDRGAITAVPTTIGATFEAGTPVKLFDARLETSGFRSRRFAVSADGQRFLLNRQLGATTQAGFVVVQNWTADLPTR
jgi:serine/threonine protein kinase/Tol biopolymer transport system component